MLRGITVNAHSSVRVEAEGKVLYVDPFKLQAAPHDADLIFLTHDHFDHYSPEDVEKVLKETTVFVLPQSTAKAAAAQIGNRGTVIAEPGKPGAAAGIVFEAVPAYNPNKQFHPRKNGWVGYVLQLNGLRLYVAGDTDATEEAAAVRCDVAMLPIGGKYTMDALEAAALVKQMRPQAVIPIHYGSVAGVPEDFDRFREAVAGAVRVLRAF
ncbi:MAG: MBL fold metallo-hydrolase [Oscillospiraceae bacterium]|nr:MBL fold metallo-hydrolase [Oscillospiraceae bacterium]